MLADIAPERICRAVVTLKGQTAAGAEVRAVFALVLGAGHDAVRVIDPAVIERLNRARALLHHDVISTDDLQRLPNRPPVAVADGPSVAEATGSSGALVPLSASASSDPDGDALAFEWRDSAGQTVSRERETVVTLPLGRNAVTLSASDPRGGVGMATVSVTVRDTGAPTIVLTEPSAGSTLGSVVQLMATADDAVGVVSVAFLCDGHPIGNGLVSSPWVQQWDTSGLASGTHILTAAARDGAGNVGVSPAVTVAAPTPPSNQPPVISSLTADQPSCHPRPGTPCTISVTATASDPDGDSLTYTWSGCGSGVGATGVCSVTSLSQHTATVAVTDGRGGSAVRSVNAVGANHAPTVTISGGGQCHPRSNQYGMPATPCYRPLTASVQDLDGDTVTYAWSGCASGTAAGADCRVDSLTTFTANLVIRDVWSASGSASNSSSQGVNRAPSEPPGGSYWGTGSITIAPGSGTDEDGDWMGCYFDYDGADNLTMEAVQFCEGYSQCQPTIRVHLTDPGRSGRIGAICNDGWSDSGWASYSVSP